MKKVIIILFAIVAVAAVVILVSGNKLEGAWQCNYYAMYDNLNERWNEQPQGFCELFEMKIYPDGKIIVSTSGKESEGEYLVNQDTLNVDIKDNITKYVIDKNTLTLVGHPRAKIVYTKVGKIQEEE